MDGETQLYRDLQKFLDTLPGGFPAADSGADIRLLQHLFTPEEARVALYLTMKPETAAQIRQRMAEDGNEVSLEYVRNMLESMLYKGTLRPYFTGYDETHYRAPDPTAGGMLSVQLDHKLTREFNDLLNAYAREAFVKRASGVSLNPLRTVPVEKSIPRPEKVPVNTYDDIRKMIDAAPGPFAVANCVCRQKAERFGKKCSKTKLNETCLMVDPDHARRYVDMGVGRYIEREEVFDILDKAQQDGLVVQPENSQRPEAVCICCGDCCVFLKPMKALPRPAEFFITNYYAVVSPELCNGCEVCVSKCQMDARIMEGGIAVVNLDRCIGCGNCVVLCPVGANRMEKKTTETVPPADKEGYYRVLLDRQ